MQDVLEWRTSGGYKAREAGLLSFGHTCSSNYHCDLGQTFLNAAKHASACLH